VNQKKIRQIRTAFNYADLDGDGAIDFEEFMTVMKIEHGVLAQSLWKHYDKNNDSSIDFREFITRLAESLSIKSMDDRAEWAFELYDLDRDGILTLKEIADSLNDKNVGIPWDREQLKSIFSDESIRDDKVTKDEFLRVAKTCSTLIFPAFIMLDTVKAKVFMYQRSHFNPYFMPSCSFYASHVLLCLFTAKRTLLRQLCKKTSIEQHATRPPCKTAAHRQSNGLRSQRSEPEQTPEASRRI